MSTPYDPVLRVDHRRDDEGGPALKAVRAWWRTPPGSQQDQRELIVLVHGFNNDRSEASKAYAGMRSRQRALLGEDVFSSFDASLGDDFWPGDADWGLFDFADFLIYPQAVGVARDEVAVPLADYLRARRDVQTVHFVAHSLGCRVVLETLMSFADKGGPVVGKVCLMAAAVPVPMLFPGGRLERALAVPQEILVLYSPDDLVLSAAFPAGQTLAGLAEGFFPEAVGHAGNVPGAVQRRHIVGAGHGHYWGHSKGAASQEAAQALYEFLGLGAFMSRSVATRSVGAPRNVAGRREVAATARETLEWSFGGAA